MNKKIFLSILISALVLPISVFAQSSGSSITVESITGKAVQTTFLVASGIVVILWVVTGLLFLQAQGAPDKLSTAKKALIAAVAGTAIVIIAGSAIALVKSALSL